MDIIEEYTYKAGIKQSEIIDKTVAAILKTRRPKTFALLNAIRWRPVWKLAGIRMNVRHKGELYEEYELFQFDTLLASFELRTNLQTT